MVFYFTILILGVTIICDSVALTSVSDKSYRRASTKRLVQMRQVSINHHGNRGGHVSARHSPPGC